ncbi:MAG TPA: hypothetical protein VH113_12145 [Gemmatimonadales bacterium]|nr:hypothetical protein [Gemmatimonadales bacterium]
MRLPVLLSLQMIPILAAAQQPPLSAIAPPLHIQVDSAHHQVLITGGPYRVPVTPEMPGMMMDMPTIPVQKFAFPADGWLQGFRVDLFDDRGHALSHRLLHHLIMVNFSRRQFIYPALERLLGVAEETDTGDMRIPGTIGVPMQAGQELGIYAMWHNDSGPEIPVAYWRVVLYMTPARRWPRPIDVLPAYLDVNIQTNPEENRFNVPPGHFEIGYEFSPPLSGHLLVATGHLHDYGVLVRLVDAASGKTLVEIKSKRDSLGHVLSMPRKLLAIRGEGLRLKAGHHYRVVGVFDNPTRDTSYGAMAEMVGLFAPDHYREWPAVDPADSYYQRDLVALVANGVTDSVIVGKGVPILPKESQSGRRDSNP